MASSSSNVVGVHYRVGKKIGEGSFGVIFEGTNLLNNQQVAIKFVSRRVTSGPERWLQYVAHGSHVPPFDRNLERAMLPSFEMSIEHTRSSSAAVCSSTFNHVAYSVAHKVIHSGHSQCLLLWTRGSPQHPGHRPPRSVVRGPLRPLRTAVHNQDRCHGCEADGRPARLVKTHPISPC